MKSGLRLAARPRPAGPPVPVGESSSSWLLPGSAMRGNADEAYLRAYSTQGTVYANGSLLASATAAPVWKLFRQEQDGRRRYSTASQGSDQRVEVVRHAALALLSEPNRFWSRFRLFELSQLYQELTGKSHWVITKAGGIPVGIWPVRPDRMTPVPDPDKYLAGWMYSSPDGLEQIPLLPSEVIYNPLPNPVDAYGGTGWVQPVLTEVDGARYASQWNRNFFSNSARPDGVIQVDHRLGDDEWSELTERWRETHRGVARAHRVAVLEAGATWVATSTSPKDMDFANLQSTAGDRIREGSGMHKIMTGLVDDVNRANAQTGQEIFAAWKVAPRLTRWRDALNFQFLPMFGATGQGVEFDFIYPTPVNREQDNLELTAKSGAAAALVAAGYDQADVLVAVGLPAMGVAERPTQMPAMPPGWVPAPPAAPGGTPAPGGAQGEPEGGDPENLWRRLLATRERALLNHAGGR